MIKVELGSGYHPNMDFNLHIDINPNCPHLEYVRSVDDLKMFTDNTIDEIRACDVLEHFSFRHTVDILKEWYRVLKPNGKIFIQTPNAKLLAERWLKNDLPIMEDMPIDYSASYWIMGGQDDGNFARSGDDFRWNAHYVMFSPESIKFYLEHAGFKSSDIKSDGGSNMLIWAVK